ncbi:MAG: DUF2934 domain-containing protein, partial [Nodosilinea sp.]
MKKRFTSISWIRNKTVEIAESRTENERARVIQRMKAIQLKAYYLWEADGKLEGLENYYWSKAEELTPPLRKYHSPLPFRKYRSHIRVFLEWIGLFGNIALLLAVVTYLTYGSQKQRDLEVSQAWSVISDASGKKGNGGRIEALELINASPSNSSSWRFPWLSWHYPWLAST